MKCREIWQSICQLAIISWCWVATVLCRWGLYSPLLHSLHISSSSPDTRVTSLIWIICLVFVGCEFAVLALECVSRILCPKRYFLGSAMSISLPGCGPVIISVSLCRLSLKVVSSVANNLKQFQQHSCPSPASRLQPSLLSPLPTWSPSEP